MILIKNRQKRQSIYKFSHSASQVLDNRIFISSLDVFSLLDWSIKTLNEEDPSICRPFSKVLTYLFIRNADAELIKILTQ